MKYLYQQIVKKDNIILRGVINIPDDFDKSKKYKTVIMYHGLAGDRTGAGWFRISNSEYLCDRGYVVVRFDFSGSGESDGNFYDMTLTRELEEARLIHEFTENLDFVDKKNIYWCGHSLGGVISILLASKLKVKSLVLLAPATDINNPEVLAKTYGKLGQLFLNDLDYSKEEDRKKLYDLIPIDDYDLDGVKISKIFFVDMMKYDIYKASREYKGKVLILRGKEDDLVEKIANQRLNKEFFNSTFIEIDNADHSFRNADARDEIYKLMYEFLEDK